MKKIILAFTLFSLCFSSISVAEVEGERFLQSEEAVQNAQYGHIDARGLKALLDSHLPFVLLDARGNKWHDQTMIPGALLASYENSAEELEMIIPNKDALIIVYCYSFTCPLSRRLAQKLVTEGYQNIIEYPAGLKEWRDIANYPFDRIPD